MPRTNSVLGIVGKNGTGKSTFLNLLTNSIQPDSGKIGDKMENKKSTVPFN